MSSKAIFVLGVFLCGVLTACPPAPKAKPSIVAFTASPSSIAPGGSSVLTWNVTDASSVSIDQGVGDVTGKSSIGVQPKASVSYTLSATNESGSSQASTSLTVDANTPSSPSSADLIDAALAKGDLQPEQATEYKLFADFGDPRLPAKFQGGTESLESSGVEAAIKSYASLSAAAQDIVAPFLTPPAYQGSWLWNRSHPAIKSRSGSRASGSEGGTPPYCVAGVDPAWDSIEGTHAKVWYAHDRASIDAPRAKLIASEIDSTIWTALIGRVHMIPPKDDSLTPCSGGNGKLDIYLADMRFYGQNVSDLAETDKKYPADRFASVYLLIDNKILSNDDLIATTAHEFMHASQWAYNTAAAHWDYGWLIEASATWATQAVYPNSNLERRSPPGALELFAFNPQLSLEDQTSHRDYGAYLFPFFVGKTEAETKVAAIWENTTSTSESLLAVDKALSGGLTEQFPKFARRLWNGEWNSSANGEKSFAAWDQLGIRPFNEQTDFNKVKHEIGALSPDKIENLELPAKLERLSSAYFDLKFSSDTARTVAFYNGANFKVSRENMKDLGEPYALPDGETFVASDAAQPNGLVTQALVKIGGVWQAYEDWSKDAVKVFCRDKPSEQLDEIVLIVSNPTGGPVNVDGLGPKMYASNMGCAKLPSGGMTAKSRPSAMLEHEEIAVQNFSATGQGGAASDATGKKHFFIGYTFLASTGSASITVSGDAGDGCSFQGSSSGNVPSTGGLLVYSGILSGKAYRAYTFAGVSLVNKPYQVKEVNCPPDSTVPAPQDVQAFTWMPVYDPFSQGWQQVGGDGLTMDGSSLNSDENYTWKYQLVLGK